MNNILDEINKLSEVDFSSNDIETITDQLTDCAIDAYGETAGTFISEELNPDHVESWINQKLGNEIERRDDHILEQSFDQFYQNQLIGN